MPNNNKILALFEKYRKLLGFLAFGLLAGLTYAVALILSVSFFKIPTFVGSVIAFALAIPVSYLGNRWITYRSTNMLAPEAARFIVVQLINLVLTSVVVHFVIERFAMSAYVGIVVAFFTSPIISFVLFELWVYRQREARVSSTKFLQSRVHADETHPRILR